MFKQDQEVFNILLNALSEGVIIVDKHQKIVEANETIGSIFGYHDNELIGKTLQELIPHNLRKEHQGHFISFINSGGKRKMGQGRDVFGLHSNGTTIPLEIGLNPFKIYNEEYIMALITDITDRKDLEANILLKSEALESANNGIVITDVLKEDGPIIYANSAFKRLTGYAEDEILNRNCRFLQQDDRDQESINKIREAVNKGESCHALLRNYKKDGSLFWNDLYITPLHNKNGTVTNFIGIINDVTKRKKAEEERNHLATIFDESLNEIYVFDVKTLKFINANYGAQQNLGYSLQELLNMTPIDIKPGYTTKQFKKTIDVLLKEDVGKIEFETIHRRKDGSTYPVEVHLQLSSISEKQVLVAIILDITDRKNYTNKLEDTVKQRTNELMMALEREKELNDLKTKFLSLVSHEFKTPLSGILTSTMLLSKYTQTEQQDKRDKHITTITEKVHYLNAILNDFLSLEKLETGKIIYRPTNFKLSKVIDEVIYNANMLLKDGQQINYPENIDDYAMYHDEKIIELALSNLVHNAIKYSPENTTIDIKVSQDKEKTVFKIKDNGIGIPKKDQKNIFNRYFRAENALLTQGTGIGLNIVKNHIENLDGSIYFESKTSKGSVFTIELPNKMISKE